MDNNIRNLYLFIGLVLILCLAAIISMKPTTQKQIIRSPVPNNIHKNTNQDYPIGYMEDANTYSNVVEPFSRRVISGGGTTVVSRPSTVVVGGGVHVVPTVPVVGGTTVVNTGGSYPTTGSNVVVTRTQSPFFVFFVWFFVILIILLILWLVFSPVTYVEYIDNASANTVIIV